MGLRNLTVEFNPDHSCSISGERVDGQTIVAYGPDWPAALRKLQEIVSQHHAFPPPSGQTAFQIAHRMDMLERRLSNLEGLVSPSAWHQGRGS